MARCVLITGASRGIGAAIAQEFGKLGDNVVVGYNTSADLAKAVAQQVRENGGQALAVQADVSNALQVARMFREAKEAFGAVEVLVNNAGIARQKMFCDISEAEWDEMFNVHVKGSFLCTQQALPHMVRRKAGNIQNIASIWGQVGASCESHYAAAKGALIAMTRSLAKEMGPSGIRVNCISPGAINTEMLELTGQAKEDFCAETPLGCIGNPEDVANLSVFLASEKASFITGQTLGVNGGLVV